jgi:hypothetical protein
MRSAPLILAAIVLGGCSSGFDDGALLWRGFNHKWDYNHRLARMGDRIIDRGCGNGEASCGGFSLHAGAAGPERDHMDFISYYSRVLVAGVAFATVDVEHVLGARNSGIVEQFGVTTLLSIDDFPNLENRDHYAVILGGFDLVSQGPDDKLMFFQLGAEEARWRAEERAVELEYNIALSMDCQSSDCEDNFFEYKTTASFVVIGWDGTDVEYTEDTIQRVDSWDAYPWCVNDAGELDAPDCTLRGDGTNPDAGEPELQRTPREIDGVGGTTNAFIGFKSILVDLGEREAPDVDKAQHLLAFRIGIHPRSHDPSTGSFEYELDMLFKSWHRGMQESDPAARLTYPETGAATWRAEMGLFQLFVYSQIDHGQIEGEVEWPAGASYTEADAERWASLEFNQTGF